MGLLLGACAPATPTSGGSAPPAPGLSHAGTVDTGDLTDPAVRVVEIGGRPLRVAFVDEPDDRARGLMGVSDLGALDGMLFDLDSERVHTFTMRNTLIPLEIRFFDSDGRSVGSLVMEPCTAEPCPSYSIDSPSRFALESPVGSLDLPVDAVLTYP